MALPSHSCRRRRYYSPAGACRQPGRPARLWPPAAAWHGARACAVPVFISFVQGGVSRYQETYTL